VAHLSASERAQRGRAARKRVPRASHAIFEPSPRRPDPVQLLERQAKTRVADLVPIRYGRMLSSPLAFYRGAALVMANDLAQTPSSGLRTQCCGDAHLSNFGVFASPERRLVFDINDFDETLPGPWEWDVKRLATSILIASQSRDFAAKDQDQAVLDTVEQYRAAMAEFAAMTNLAVWYANVDIDAALARFGRQFRRRALKRTERALAQARTRDSMSALSKLSREIDGQPRIVADPPLIVPLDDLAQGGERDELLDSVHTLLSSYRASLQRDRALLLEQFEMVDAARKVVGVGSVGTRSWIVLLLGRDAKDPLFLQVKEAGASVLEGLAGNAAVDNQGERVVVGQHVMQASSDILLGWLRVDVDLDGSQRDYYVRQLRDWKGSAEVDQMDAQGLTAYGSLCGWTLARAHARSGDRIAIAAYLGRGPSFDKAVLEFSHAYAEQNQRDFRALAKAVKAGRVAARTGL
jgi:uncharacterized protein (DUF2252 family)